MTGEMSSPGLLQPELMKDPRRSFGRRREINFGQLAAMSTDRLMEKVQRVICDVRSKCRVAADAKSSLKGTFQSHGSRRSGIKHASKLCAIARATLNRNGALSDGGHHILMTERVKLDPWPIANPEAIQAGGSEDGSVGRVLLTDLPQPCVYIASDFNECSRRIQKRDLKSPTWAPGSDRFWRTHARS
jgi:hypothetical protein